MLGTLPDDTAFDYYELYDGSRVDEYSVKYDIAKERFIIDSDSHYLTDMRDKENYLELEDEPCEELLVSRIFDYLRRPRQ